MRDMIIASTSTLHGGKYLEYLTSVLVKRLKRVDASQLLFIPFARPGGISHDDYTSRVREVLLPHDIEVVGLHTQKDLITAVQNAKAIFTGGGNTFQLVKMLHEYQLLAPLRQAIYSGTFYLGTSAGSNICGLNMRTTNDMPVVQPASFKTIGAIGYNINPHYLDPDKNSKHMGETREQRIAEFHIYNNIPVVGLREGSYIDVQGDQEILRGELDARIFEQEKNPYEVAPGYDFASLA
ncbi:dipeptidase PepE [Nonlabens ponticola]|uniref:Dipeptidase PepE n=1 Tax=Nonlabens ponticola TaxID=2496866 RepID=A0A3S9MUP5_9FLAO|nr:dipeptidase PepE [Nonlabens ponticola]AZQ42860.1 dipeptidase PepE [Nonlabens ponticola]